MKHRRMLQPQMRSQPLRAPIRAFSIKVIVHGVMTKSVSASALNLQPRADDLDDVPGSFPVPGVLIPGPSIRIVSSVPTRPAAIEKPAERTGAEGPPQSHGDPWLSTLITAQLSRNSSLMRVGDSSQANSTETFRSLTGIAGDDPRSRLPLFCRPPPINDDAGARRHCGYRCA